MVEECNALIPTLSDSPMFGNILKQQLEEISHILRTLEIPHRHARALNFLGSALKFVAGNPDHDDYELLLTKQNYLIENNNKQTKINSQLEKRINEITDLINSIVKNSITKKEDAPLFEYLINRNNIIINYLNNIVLSIVLAKNNLINPLILDEIDIKKMIEIEGLQDISISNILLATKIKVLQNSTSIHYILKVPKILKFCQFLSLYPVSHNNTIVKLPTQQAAKCSDASYPISDCVKATNIQICKPFNSTCLFDLLNNNTATCPTENSHHIPSVDKLEEGVIILNDVFPTIIEEGHNITVKGTFLIMFKTTVKINYTKHSVEKKATLYEAHPPKMVSLKILDHENKISLPYLHKLNIDNTNIIQSLTDDFETHTTLWWSATSIIGGIIFIALCYVLVRKMCCKKTRKISELSPELMQSIICSLTHRSEAAQS